jgi:hypothetical protein
MITPNKSLGTILLFPGRRHGCRDQQYELGNYPSREDQRSIG